MDGTFHTCPAPYAQFFTIHGKYRNRVILFASCLTTGKNIGQYKQILQTLKRRICQETGHRWRPTRAIAHSCSANRTPKFPSKWMLFLFYQSPLATHPDTWNVSFLETACTSSQMHQESHGDWISAITLGKTELQHCQEYQQHETLSTSVSSPQRLSCV